MRESRFVSFSSSANRALTSAFLTLAAGVGFMVLGGGTALAQRQVRLGMEVPSVVRRSTRLSHSNPSKILHLSISLPYRNPGAIETFVASVSNPSSPNYRHFLTPEQVGTQFGLPDAQVNGVASFLASHGLKIDLVGKNHLSILAEGTVDQVERTFNTSVNEFQAKDPNEPGRTRYFSFTMPPQVPAKLAPYIVDVRGLENFTKPKHRTLDPIQARTLYDLAPTWTAGFLGENRNVAISNFDGFKLSNFTLFAAAYNLPIPAGGVGSNINVVTLDGGAQNGPAGGEGDIDMQMVLGMAPLCNLTIYDEGNDDLIALLTREADDNTADVINESYGWNLPPSTAAAAHQLHLAMSAQGITYMAASGDNGASLEPFSYPNYDPEVLMVGGTVATVDDNGNRVTEVGWEGSGGGWSTNTAAFNRRPTWQKGAGVPSNVGFRLTPDVALHASGPNSASGAYFFFYQGVLSSDFIGTSFASPVFAGSLAVAEEKIIANGGLIPFFGGRQRFGRIQDLFYLLNGRPDVWFDVTSGSNGTLPNGLVSKAGPGWDTVTGWGAIDFDAFANLLSEVPVSYAPTGSSLYQADGSNGDFTNLTAVDGSTFDLDSVAVPAVGQVAAGEIDFTLDRLASVYGGATFNTTLTAQQNVTVQVFVYNYDTEKFDLLQSFASKGQTQTLSLPIWTLGSQAATSYVDSGTGAMRFIVRGVEPDRYLPTPYTLSIDEADLATFVPVGQ